MKEPSILAAIKQVALLMQKEMLTLEFGAIRVDCVVQDGEVTVVKLSREVQVKMKQSNECS